MANPSKIAWSFAKQYEDDSAFAAADFAGFTIYIDGSAGLSVPAGWDDDGSYELPLSAIPDLVTFGDHTVQMTIVAQNGQESPKSNSETYTYADERVPKAPFGLSVS